MLSCRNDFPILPQVGYHNRRPPGQNTPTEASFRKEKERTIMSNNSSNKLNVPQAKQGMEQFKMQAANEVGVNLTNGYNGDLTSREAGTPAKPRWSIRFGP